MVVVREVETLARERLPLAHDGLRLEFDDEGSAEIRRVVMAGDGAPFAAGGVAFVFTG